MKLVVAFCSGVVVLLAAVARECTFEKHVFVWRVLHFSHVGRLGAERKREGFLKKADRKIFQNATTNTRANASEKHQKLTKTCSNNATKIAPGGFRERLGGLLRGSSAPERVQDRPWDPPGPPKQTLEARPRPQERPNGASRASGPPPGAAKNAPKCNRRFWSHASWGPGAPPEPPERLPEAI